MYRLYITIVDKLIFLEGLPLNEAFFLQIIAQEMKIRGLYFFWMLSSTNHSTLQKLNDLSMKKEPIQIPTEYYD